MRAIEDYIDAAQRNLGLRSDRQLAPRLGITQSSISCWRSRRSWPTEASMVKLASLGNMDPQEAVLDLLEWRNSDYPEVRRVLAEIKKKAVAASIGLLISVGALLGTPHEAAAAGMMSAKTGYTIYYGK